MEKLPKPIVQYRNVKRSFDGDMLAIGYYMSVNYISVKNIGQQN